MLSSVILIAAAVAIASAAPLEKPGGIASFNWQPCGRRAGSLQKCATLEVPLNYLDASDNRTFPLAISWYPAKKPSRGGIIVNPGGPGASGVNFAESTAKTLPLDDSYDIFGFDPRGIGNSVPIVCSPNPAVQYAYENEDLGDPGRKGGVTYNVYDAYAEVRARGCSKFGAYNGDWVKYLSTALTARDMESLRIAVGMEKMNFVGYSYGTFLGMTYANMFPNNVGRMVIDGVVDPIFFSQNIYEDGKAAYKDADAVLFGFAKECELAGPLACALYDLPAKLGITAKAEPGKNLLTAIRQSIKDLAENPAIAMEAEWPGLVKDLDVDSYLYSTMYNPEDWPYAAKLLADLFIHNDPNPFRDEDWGSANPTKFCPANPRSGSNGYYAVRCADAEDLRNVGVEEAVRNAGRPGGRIFAILDALTCRHWVRPVERFDGPWNSKLSNKILIVSSTVDPITPLAGAKKVHSILTATDSSYLLVHNGYGHTSLAQPSACSLKTVANYLMNGTLLNEGKGFRAECSADLPVFPNNLNGFAAKDDLLTKAAELGAEVAKIANDKRRS
ncbi:hypothetical protein HDU97_000101 [Phlyctochytrium planicorne]|nr:hypothetical protein HDU97_000101 [Phlyctochytrium planicorne]